MKQVIVLRADLKLGKGKLVAQGSHASLEAYKKASPSQRQEWERDGCKKIVAKVESLADLKALHRQALAAKLPVALITDAGHTQVSPGTVTALGIGPAADGKLDPFTRKLKLL
ncbi:MAG: peptidyl-tRNA hydrolase Pth2 [Nanoarchaeota archaeon]|nr:peptidyl-tRNA hydrolase Pth2 [Nanoarchaeota archaeon]